MGAEFTVDFAHAIALLTAPTTQLQVEALFTDGRPDLRVLRGLILAVTCPASTEVVERDLAPLGHAHPCRRR